MWALAFEVYLRVGIVVAVVERGVWRVFLWFCDFFLFFDFFSWIFFIALFTVCEVFV